MSDLTHSRGLRIEVVLLADGVPVRTGWYQRPFDLPAPIVGEIIATAPLELIPTFGSGWPARLRVLHRQYDIMRASGAGAYAVRVQLRVIDA